MRGTLHVCVWSLFLSLHSANAIPSLKVPAWAYNTTLADSPCTQGICTPPSSRYSLVLDVTPRLQWTNDGGYCGSMSIQQLALNYGVWVSQQQVRAHTVDGGGHDQEIVETNIELALKNLKLTFDGWNYKTQPTPQLDAYLTWVKSHLTQGHGVVWMIMLNGGHYPVYPALRPYGFYSHVEPVYGIYSNHPLDDPKWYDDDYVVHSTDIDFYSYYRRFDSLPANVTSYNTTKCPMGDYSGYPCVWFERGFGWAITGVEDRAKGRVPVTLHVDRTFEPPPNRPPTKFKGTLGIKPLQVGVSYEVWRWDNSTIAYNYLAGSVLHRFVAADQNYTWVDPTPILSNGTTYYSCVPAFSGRSGRS